jgi:hypothetical protein
LQLPDAWLPCITDGLDLNFRRAPADMPRDGVAPHPMIPLGRYRHFKGGMYRVTGGRYDATSKADRVLVSYRSEADGFDCTRTPDDFTALVPDGVGGQTQRFYQITEEETG